MITDKRKYMILTRYVHKENESGNKVNATKIIRSNNLIPSRRTVAKWLQKHDTKSKHKR